LIGRRIAIAPVHFNVAARMKGDLKVQTILGRPTIVLRYALPRYHKNTINIRNIDVLSNARIQILVSNDTTCETVQISEFRDVP